MHADHTPEESSRFEFTDRDYLLLFGTILIFFLPCCELGYAAIKHVEKPNLVGLSLSSYAIAIGTFWGALGLAAVYLRQFDRKWVKFILCSLVAATLGVAIGEARHWLPQLVCSSHSKLSDAPSVWGFVLAWQLPSIKAKAKLAGIKPLA